MQYNSYNSYLNQARGSNPTAPQPNNVVPTNRNIHHQRKTHDIRDNKPGYVSMPSKVPLSKNIAPPPSFHAYTTGAYIQPTTNEIKQGNAFEDDNKWVTISSKTCSASKLSREGINFEGYNERASDEELYQELDTTGLSDINTNTESLSYISQHHMIDQLSKHPSFEYTSNTEINQSDADMFTKNDNYKSSNKDRRQLKEYHNEVQTIKHSNRHPDNTHIPHNDEYITIHGEQYKVEDYSHLNIPISPQNIEHCISQHGGTTDSYYHGVKENQNYYQGYDNASRSTTASVQPPGYHGCNSQSSMGSMQHDVLQNYQYNGQQYHGNQHPYTPCRKFICYYTQ
ncbi:hypothetical protein GJ496_010190 [Pomphorhynchus laevis]|nr:hypothetical protein GJ496_010190 [Pomphorhynchus laevis]